MTFAMRPLLIAAMLAGSLSACVETGGGYPAPGPVGAGPNACGALDLQYLVGAPDTVLETVSFGGPVRVISPGQAVTMDYNPRRLNVELDQYRMINRVTCG